MLVAVITCYLRRLLVCIQVGVGKEGKIKDNGKKRAEGGKTGGRKEGSEGRREEKEVTEKGAEGRMEREGGKRGGA